MNDIVFVDKIDSFPKEIIQYLRDNSFYLKRMISAIIGREGVNSFSSLEFNCLDKRENKELKSFVDYLESVFNQYRLVGYHYTRIESTDSILQNGLRTLEWDYYSRFLSSVLCKYGVHSTIIFEALTLVKSVYDGKQGGRKDNLCFFTPLSVLANHPEYAKFGENIGGEIAERALESDMPEIFEILKSNGSPVIIEFSFPFRDIASFRRDDVSWFIAKSLISHFILGEEIPVMFDGIIRSSVPGESILRIISQKDLQYQSVFDWLALP